jgi:hypothetical protein
VSIIVSIIPKVSSIGLQIFVTYIVYILFTDIFLQDKFFLSFWVKLFW